MGGGGGGEGSLMQQLPPIKVNPLKSIHIFFSHFVHILPIMKESKRRNKKKGGGVPDPV